jgi:hypothetical protein
MELVHWLLGRSVKISLSFTISAAAAAARQDESAE